MRSNPGPFEPFVYVLQTRASYRALGLGGLALLSILAFSIAAAHSDAAVLLGFVLLGALWYEASTNICRRCRFYGTWHCLGQGMIVARLYSRLAGGVSEAGVTLHAAVAAVYLLWALYWLWHWPLLGALFTIWLPLALISTTTPQGYSWRALKAEQS
jgi:hypothetical protein